MVQCFQNFNGWYTLWYLSSPEANVLNLNLWFRMLEENASYYTKKMYNMIWKGMIFYDIIYCMIWFDLALYDGCVKYDIVWYGNVSFDRVFCITLYDIMLYRMIYIFFIILHYKMWYIFVWYNIISYDIIFFTAFSFNIIYVIQFILN